MLLKNFSVPVLIANLVAWPFAYYACLSYLNLFNDAIDITPLPFLLAMVVSLLVSWIAIYGQTWKAANTSPQQFMRYE